MKKSTFMAIITMVILAVIAVTANHTFAQDLSTNYGCSAIADDNVANSYHVTLTGVSQKKAVELLVDQIKAKCETPQQVSCYIVEYSDKVYTINLDEEVSGHDGFPMTFTSMSDVKTFIKKDLKYALDNL